MSDTSRMRREHHFGDRVVTCFAERPRRIIDKIDAVVARYPDSVAIVDGARRVTYAALAERVAALAGHLRALGLERGERVGIVLPNGLEFVVALLASWRLGAVPVPLNTREAGAEASFTLSDCAAAGLIPDPAFPDALPPPGGVASLRWRLAVGGIPETAADPVRAPAPEEIGEDDMAAIVYTSGTTGRPKGAMLTHLGIIHSTLHYEHHFGVGPDDTALLVVPATHITGLIGVVVASLGAGAKLVTAREFNTRRVVELAARERMTYTIMVPAMYNLLLLREDLSASDLSCWRVGAYGGSVMPEATIRELARLRPG